MDYSDDQILEVMGRMGIDQDTLRRAQSNGRSLDALKARAKKAYRKLALEVHPDRTGGDAEKSRLFQLATEVLQEIERMQVVSHPRRIKWAIRLKAVAAT